MIRWTVHILVLVTVIGCGNQHTRQESAFLEGVTLADIMPTVTEESVPVMSFIVSVFHVNAEHAQTAQSCWEDLSRSAVRYNDPDAFERNGFFASFGAGMQLGPVGSCLAHRGAQRIGQTTLVLNPGFELPFGGVPFDQTQSVEYHGIDGNTTTTSLSAGMLGWSLKAELIPDSPGRLRATFEPTFVPWAAQVWTGSEFVAQQLSRRFEAGRFEVSMRTADFIVLGPQHTTIEEFTDFERLLFLASDPTEQIRFYIIMCARVEN